MKNYKQTQAVRKSLILVFFLSSFTSIYSQTDSTTTLSPEVTELLNSINEEINQHQNKRLEVSNDPTLDSAAQANFWYQTIDKIIQELELKREAILNGDY